MSSRNDIVNKINGHIRAYNEHVQKAKDYSTEQDRAYAQKTADRIYTQHIEPLRAQLNENQDNPSVQICPRCGKIHS